MLKSPSVFSKSQKQILQSPLSIELPLSPVFESNFLKGRDRTEGQRADRHLAFLPFSSLESHPNSFQKNLVRWWCLLLTVRGNLSGLSLKVTVSREKSSFL